VKLPLKCLKTMLGMGLMLALLLSACEGLPFELPWLDNGLPTPTEPAEETGLVTPTPDATPQVEDTPPPVTQLTIWVPPEMDPSLETDASILFSNRLLAFSVTHGGIDVQVRVKAASGPGGLLDALTATSAAAPAALPDLIALTRPDLETAALKNLVFPMDGITAGPEDPDWYSFARDIAILQGSTFGLPFATDALALVYRPESIADLPDNWTDLFESEEEIALAFPVDQDQALFPMTLYLAEGGAFQDSQRRPLLELEPLTDVFRLFDDGAQAGMFPDAAIQYQTLSQVWTAFREGQVDFAVTWVSNILKENPPDAQMLPLYPGSEGSVTLGTGMSWALSTPDANRHQLAVALAEFLVQEEFLADWTAAAGYMPPRPSSLQGWQNPQLRTTVSQIALTTI
jgi:multiple sugar transport system substrate-binding protein